MTDGPTDDQLTSQIRLDLEALYRAGRQDFPDKAEDMSGWGTTLGTLLDDAQAQAAKAADVTSLVFNDLQQTHYLLYEAVRACVLTLNDCAEGCLAAAAQFRQEEDTSNEAYAGLSGELPWLTDDAPAPQAPEPPARPDPTA